MKHRMLKPMAVIVTVIALLFAFALPVSIAAQTTAAPQWGVPGSTFTFLGSGFKGATDKDPAYSGEKLTFWINTPDGRVIDTVRLDKEDSQGRLEVPMKGTARHNGTFVMTWKAPLDSVIGGYTFVAHGVSSKHEQVFPFVIKPQSEMRTTQHTVVPTEGKAGTAFYFSAVGFKGGPTKDDAGEHIAYWVNTPDGRVISTVADKGEDEQAPRPLTDRARHDGTVRLVWTSPANAPAGNYTLVMHGLDTQTEVVLPFTIIR